MFIKKKSERDFTTDVVKVLIGITSLIVLLFTYTKGISGNDFWWHVKVGEWICENRTIPKQDIFSWYGTAREFSWIAHEWLSEVIFYKIFSAFGQSGIYLFSLMMAISLLGIVYKCIGKYLEENVYITIFFIGMFAIAERLFFYGRPHIFSFYLLFFELKILYDFYENPEKKSIFFLPFIGCLWGNLHGGSSSMVYILPIIFLIVSVCNIDYGRVYAKRLPKRGIIVLGIVTLLTVLSLMINPNGFEMILYPYVNMGDNLMQQVIREWAAPDAKELSNLLIFYIPIVIMSLGMLITKKKLRLLDLIIVLFFLFLFFRSIRFIMLWYIAAVFYAFPYVPQCKLTKIQSKGEKILAIAAVCILLIPTGITMGKVVKNSLEEDCISTAMSLDAIEVVKKDRPERLFNDYNFGETLIYHEIDVFLDARADVYSGTGVLKDAMELTLLMDMDDLEKSEPVDVEALRNKYDFDAILIQKARPLYVYMKSNPEIYEYVFENDEVAYYRIKE